MAANTDQGRIQTIPARLLAALTPGYIQIIMCPNQGLADGGIPVDIPLALVPAELRMPNTELSVTLQNGNVISVGAAAANA